MDLQLETILLAISLAPCDFTLRDLLRCQISVIATLRCGHLNYKEFGDNDQIMATASVQKRPKMKKTIKFLLTNLLVRRHPEVYQVHYSACC